MPIAVALADPHPSVRLTAFIGPEGGWTSQEVRQFIDGGATPVRLTSTILRMETAAVTTAAVVMCLAGQGRSRGPLDGRATHEADPPAGATARTGTTP